MRDINAQDKKININDSFVAQAQRQGRLGWVAFTIVLVVLMLQNLFYALKPKDVWAANENGDVVGQVVFDESRYRSNDDVISDFKSWVVNCVSVNKLTIINDESICLTHMNSELSEKRYTEMLSNAWIEKVIINGCNKTDYKFNDEKTILVERNRAGYQAEMNLSGTVICSDSGTPISQDFYINAHARLKPRNSNKPLAIEVYEMEDL
jgi:hypothetical protein